MTTKNSTSRIIPIITVEMYFALLRKGKAPRGYNYLHLLTLTSFGQEQPVRGIWVEPLTEIETTVGTYLVANWTVESCWDLSTALYGQGIDTDFLDEDFHILPHSQLCDAPAPTEPTDPTPEDSSSEPVAVAEIIEPVAAEEVAPAALVAARKNISVTCTSKHSHLTAFTTLTIGKVYHAQLPKNVIATIKEVGVNGECVNISVDSDGFKIESMFCPEIFSKTYKTITGAIKGALKFINNVAGSDIEVYINPAHINILPAKWANAEARPVIKFEVGASYATNEGYVYTVTRSCVSEYSGTPLIGLIDSRLINQQYPDDFYIISYDNGSEICERKLIYKTILRADQPVETIEITTQGEITESDVNFTDGDWDITPTPDGSDEPTDSGNTPASESTHTTLKSAVALHFNAAAATKSFQAFYLAFYRKLAKTNSCTLEICGQMVTITRLEKGDFAVSAQSQPIAPQPEMPAPAITPVKKLSITRTPALKTLAQNTTHGWNADSLSDDELAKALMYNRAAQTLAFAAGYNAFRNKIKNNKLYILHQAASKDLEIHILREYNKRGLGDKYAFDVTVLPKTTCAEQEKETAPAPIDWHTIIDEIAISDFNLIDSREWADHISEAEKEFDAMMETERAEMQCDDYEAEQAIERKKSPPVPSFELLAYQKPAKARRAGKPRFVQITPMLFDMPKVSATDLIARRAAQRKYLSDRMPPAPLFDRGI